MPLGGTMYRIGATLSRMLGISVVLCLATSPLVSAHRSGCHRWHSCPSDHGTYTCGDLGYCSTCPDNQYCTNGSPNGRRASSSRVSPQAPDASGDVRGNRNSKVYWVPGCKGYAEMQSTFLVTFDSEAEAQQAGYRRAKDCP